MKNKNFAVDDYEAKKQHLTGSELAAAIGWNPWKTPVQVFKEKTGTPPKWFDNERMEWGRKLEDLVAKKFVENTGKRLQRDNSTRYHKKYPLYAGHIDRKVIGEKAIWEGKTTQSYEGWGASGSDIIPRHYVPQVVLYMSIYDCDHCYISVLIRGFEYREYIMERNLEQEDYILSRGLEFWHNYVEKGIAPPPVTVDDCSLIYPIAEDGTKVFADGSVETAISDMINIDSQRKALEVKYKAKEKYVKEFMKEKELLISQRGQLAKWSSVKTNRIDTKLLRENYPEQAEECTKVTESRRFSINKKG